MASISQKISTLIQANLHALVDQALQSNSLAVIDQYIRQVESNLTDLEEAAATIGGQVRTLRRKAETYREQESELDQAINTFLQEGKDDYAAAAQNKLNSAQRLTETYLQQAEQQQTEYRALIGARSKLESRLEVMRQEREELQALLTLARSKETTVQAMKSLDALRGAGDSDLTRIAESIHQRLDRANAAGALRAGSLESEMERALTQSTVEQQLAQRRKELGMDDQAWTLVDNPKLDNPDLRTSGENEES